MHANSLRILVVEDDPVARAFLGDNLVADGYDVVEAGTAAGARHLLSTAYIDAVLLDLGLPDNDGLELLAHVRSGDRVAARFDPEVPLLVISGRAGELDRLRGFRAGADDYLGKPFSYPELHARLRALLRRVGTSARGSRIRVGPLEINTLSHEVWLNGEPLHLSGKEFSLLVALASDPVRVHTREELLRVVWGFPEPCRTRTLDSHAHRLRHKLGRGGERFVVNVWGIGYRLVDGGSSQ